MANGSKKNDGQGQRGKKIPKLITKEDLMNNPNWWKGSPGTGRRHPTIGLMSPVVPVAGGNKSYDDDGIDEESDGEAEEDPELMEEIDSNQATDGDEIQEIDVEEEEVAPDDDVMEEEDDLHLPDPPPEDTLPQAEFYANNLYGHNEHVGHFGFFEGRYEGAELQFGQHTRAHPSTPPHLLHVESDCDSPGSAQPSTPPRLLPALLIASDLPRSDAEINSRADPTAPGAYGMFGLGGYFGTPSPHRPGSEYPDVFSPRGHRANRSSGGEISGES